MENADFSCCEVAFVNFSDSASLKRVNWTSVAGLEAARVDGTYLDEPIVRALVKAGSSEQGHFDDLDLHDLNLDAKNLSGASFRNTNLSGAAMRQANLKGANLSGADLQGADLSGADLTGAVIENLKIYPNTELKDLKCDFVYMRTGYSGQPTARRPENVGEIFGHGGFADFIRPLTNTIDLYHSFDVDPNAISLAYQGIVKTYSSRFLSAVGLEIRSLGYSLKLEHDESIQGSELAQTYLDRLNELRKHTPEELVGMMAAQRLHVDKLGDVIHRLIEVVSSLKEGPRVNVTSNKGNAVVIVGDGNRIGDISTELEPTELDATELSREILMLLDALKSDPNALASLEEEELESLEKASEAAKQGETNLALEFFKGANKWVWDTAQKTGTKLILKLLDDVI